jgi:hypothetical protein
LHSAKANVCREPGQTGSRQRVLKKKKKKILSRARPAKLSAEIFFKKKRKTFAESMARLALSKEFFQKKKGKLFAESQPDGLSAKKATAGSH